MEGLEVTTLREQLIAAKLAGTKAEGDHYYTFRSNESAADAALAVFIEWFRDEMRTVVDALDNSLGGE